MNEKTPETSAIPLDFVPYVVELLVMRSPDEALRHYVYVYANAGRLVIELHTANPPTLTSQLGFYGQQWIITKTRGNEAFTELIVTKPGGWITRYVISTRIAQKLCADIAIFEAQYQTLPKLVSPALNTNQHFISQTLLRRFTTSGRLQKYVVKHGWSKRGSAPSNMFSEDGYNQLLAFGEFNNELDERLKPLEDTLPDTLAALDKAAHGKETTLDPEIFKRMCSYCAFLWEMSPFIKLAAPFHFVQQMMLDLSHKNIDFLDALGVKDGDIAQIIQHHAKGGKFILTSRNGKSYRQLAYRLQFSKQLVSTDNIFRFYTQWTVARSPIELPIADMALVKYHLPKTNAMEIILPISSNMVLIGNSPMGKNMQPSTATTIKGGELTESGADYVRKVICQAAILNLASNTRIGDVGEWRKTPVVNLMQLQNPEEILKSGTQEITAIEDLLITPADTDTYVKWVHSFIKPNSNPST